MIPSAFIFWEFIGSLFSFFALISIGSALFFGYILGYRQVGIVGLIFWCSLILFWQATQMFIFDPYISSLIHIRRTGVSSGAGWILNAHLIFHPSMLLLAIIIGRMSFAVEVNEINQRGTSLTAPEVVGMLNVLGNHPELAAAGWFSNRWAKMDDAEKSLWAAQNLDKLRELWMLGFDHDDDGGFEGFGLSLSVELAKLDQHSTGS